MTVRGSDKEKNSKPLSDWLREEGPRRGLKLTEASLPPLGGIVVFSSLLNSIARGRGGRRETASGQIQKGDGIARTLGHIPFPKLVRTALRVHEVTASQRAQLVAN
jgi:hypothetical protein